MPALAPAPDLGSYDVVLISVSGGKDSQAAASVVALAARAAGVAERTVAVHADLPDDWPGADEYAELHSASYGIARFEKVERLVHDPETGAPVPQGVIDHVLARGKFPDKARRWCTSDHKRGPARKLMTALVREIDPTRLGRPVRILSVFGFRAAESADRALHAPLRHDAAASNSRRHVDEWSPIHPWSTREVIDYVDATGVAHHPAYDGDDGAPWAGVSRLSCRFCVLASAHDLRIAARRHPQEATRIIGIEQKIGHTFRPNKSLAEILRH